MSRELIAVGEPLVAFVASSVPLFEAATYSTHVVGAEMNVAIGLARLGHRSTFVGRVGMDAFGAMIRRRLLSEGVETRFLADDSRPTGVLFRNRRETPAPEVIYRRTGSAGGALAPEDIDIAFARASPHSMVHISGVTPALSETACAAVFRAVELASNAGHSVSLDLNYRSRLWGREAAEAVLRELTRAATVVVGTRSEGQLLTGKQSVGRIIADIRSMGPEVVVIRDGLVAYACAGSDEVIEVGGRALTAVADPVGAGDGFVAGLLSALFDEARLVEALVRAHRCGAAVVGAVGDIEGLPTRAELDLLDADIVR